MGRRVEEEEGGIERGCSRLPSPSESIWDRELRAALLARLLPRLALPARPLPAPQRSKRTARAACRGAGGRAGTPGCLMAPPPPPAPPLLPAGQSRRVCAELARVAALHSRERHPELELPVSGAHARALTLTLTLTLTRAQARSQPDGHFEWASKVRAGGRVGEPVSKRERTDQALCTKH